jgi:hypothetical protein
MNFLLQALIAFLPRQYRKVVLRGGEVSRGPAMASGAAEVLLAMDLLIHHYFAYANHWLSRVPDRVWMGGFSAEGEPSMMGLGVFMLVGFLLQPLTIILLYFAAEGGSRGLAALMAGEIRGSLPIWLLAFARNKMEAWREEKKLGPRIADEVEKTAPEGDELRIASCRPKPDWNDRVTISYQQALYEVASQETGPGPRPFVYLLRPRPEYKVIRALRYYVPDEVLKAKK